MSKMWYIRILPKAVTISSREKAGFNYKNNHKNSKSANFWLNTINKINYKIWVVMSYALSRLELRKV